MLLDCVARVVRVIRALWIWDPLAGEQVAPLFLRYSRSYHPTVVVPPAYHLIRLAYLIISPAYPVLLYRRIFMRRPRIGPRPSRSLSSSLRRKRNKMLFIRKIRDTLISLLHETFYYSRYRCTSIDFSLNLFNFKLNFRLID